MKKIILHGHLKKLYDKPIEVEASTVAEAMRSLQFIEELQPEADKPWPVTIRGVDSEIALYAETDMEEIHVYPRLGGAGGKGGLFQILLGITMIALAVVNPAFLATVGITQGMLGLSGAMMILGGLMQILMPVPKTDGPNTNLYLGAAANTVKIGTRIPILYGTRRIGGHYLSYDVDAKDIALIGDPNAGTEGYNNYFQYDRTPVAITPLRPVYASQTASPSNIPVPA